MAPPKKDAGSAAVENIKTLAILMASCSEFNPDYNVVAQKIGISHAKNVPRTIDTILKPVGYQLKAKKVVEIGDETTPATPSKTPAKAKASAKTPKTPGASDTEEGFEEEEKSAKSTKKKSSTASPKKNVTRSPTKKPATPTPKSKKRKVEELVEGEGNENDEDEATKMIKEKMGDETDGEDPNGNVGGKHSEDDQE